MPTTEQRIAAIRRALSGERTGLARVRHVTTFHARRGDKLVTVRIEERGDDCHPLPRYHCHAETEDGRVAKCNGAETPEMAIAITHWQDLD